MEWIKTIEQLPPENEWELVTTGDIQKPIDVMQYKGLKKGRMVGGGNMFFPNAINYEEFIYPYWTRGFGHVMGTHPIEWASLRETE